MCLRISSNVIRSLGSPHRATEFWSVDRLPSGTKIWDRAAGHRLAHLQFASWEHAGFYIYIFHWIGLRESFNQQPPYRMVKTMVSGEDFPLNPSNEYWSPFVHQFLAQIPP